MKNRKNKAGTGHKSAGEDAPKPIGDRLLTLREAADVLRLSTRTVREYVQRGEIVDRLKEWEKVRDKQLEAREWKRKVERDSEIRDP